MATPNPIHVPLRVPIVGKDGMVTPPWQYYFQNIGGTISEADANVIELISGTGSEGTDKDLRELAALEAHSGDPSLSALRREIAILHSIVSEMKTPALLRELTELRARDEVSEYTITGLRREIQELRLLVEMPTHSIPQSDAETLVAMI